MKILPVLPLLLAVSAPALAAPTAPPAAPQIFGEAVEVNVVNVEVHVTDKNGNRVTDLRKGDFELLEDGKPVEISNFETVSGTVPRGSGAASQVPGGAPSSASAPAVPPAPGAPAATAAASPEDAWSLVVYFDNQNIRPASRTRAIQQLREFLTRQLAPGDRVMLVTNDLGLHIRLPFSSDPAAIARALDGLGKLTARGDAITVERRQAFQNVVTIQTDSLAQPNPVPCPHNIAAPAHSYAASRRQEVLHTLGSLTLLVNSLSGVPGRKAVLHVSDGIPFTPGEEVFQLLVEICGGSRASSGIGKTAMVGAMANNAEDGSPSLGYDADASERALQIYDSTTLGPDSYQAASQGPMDAQSYSVAKNLQTLAAHANAHQVTLYTLQPGLHAPDASNGDLGPEDRFFQFPAIGTALRLNNRDSLQLLADETGGRAILDANDFLPDLSRVREDALSFYSLGFTPAHSGDGREHQIEVKVKRPGLRLRYRQSYRDKTPLEKIVDRTFSALLYGIEDNPLDISVEIGEQTPGTSGLVAVPVRLRIPLFKLAILNRDEAFQGSLKLFVITRNPAGGTSPMRQVAVPLNIPRKDVLRAMGQFYVYNLTLQLQPGEQQVALAVRDEIASTTSFLSRAITVSPVNAAAVHP
jgi:VWFA-related protein